MRGRNGTYNRYYYCHNHDPVRARGEHRRCPGRNIRADALDAFVFEQLRAVLQRPDMLVAAEHTITARTPAADDQLLQAQLKGLDRRVEAISSERRRLVDLYQGGLLELAEVRRRAPRQFVTALLPETPPSGPHRRPQRDCRLPQAGTVLTRNYRGQQVVVHIVADGFEFQGRHYRSLSAIAREVTGTRWNGLAFFHLTEHRRG